MSINQRTIQEDTRPVLSSGSAIIRYTRWIPLFLAGIGIVLITTVNGIGLSPDSAGYVSTAHNIAAGNGIEHHIYGQHTLAPKFMPLMPIMLSALDHAFGGELFTAARWFNCFLFGLSLIIVSLIAAQTCRTFNYAWIIAPILMLVSAPLIQAYSMLQTEALFITLLLLNIYTVFRYFKNQHTVLLVVAGIISAALFLTRYAGVSFIAAFLATLLFTGRPGIKHRAGSCMLYGTLALLPAALWLLRNRIISGSMSGVSLQGTMNLSGAVRGILRVTVNILLPIPVSTLTRFILFCLLLSFLRGYFRLSHQA